MKVALDLDAVLAATHEVALDLLEGHGNELGYEDIESWSWGLKRYGNARFLSAIWHSWTIRPDDIEPTEPELSRKVSDIREAADELDVVTADPGHLGIKDAKREWLAEQEIEYDELLISPMGGSKVDYDYDVYIDDNPHMPAKVQPGRHLLLLYDRAYNRDVEGSYVRVNDLADAHSCLVASPLSEGWASAELTI